MLVELIFLTNLFLLYAFRHTGFNECSYHFLSGFGLKYFLVAPAAISVIHQLIMVNPVIDMLLSHTVFKPELILNLDAEKLILFEEIRVMHVFKQF